MRRVVLGLILAGLSAVLLVPGASGSGTALGAAQVVSRFKTATKEKLVVDKRSSYPGHYVALKLSVESTSKVARWGRFTLYVVTGRDVETEVNDLLVDTHTGALATPGPSRVYWEEGRTLTGQPYWLGKKRYGQNLVLWYTGGAKKVDPAFARLHKVLRGIAPPI